MGSDASAHLQQARSQEKQTKAELFEQYARFKEFTEIGERKNSAMDLNMYQGSQLAIASARVGRQQLVMVNQNLKEKFLQHAQVQAPPVTQRQHITSQLLLTQAQPLGFQQTKNQLVNQALHLNQPKRSLIVSGIVEEESNQSRGASQPGSIPNTTKCQSGTKFTKEFFNPIQSNEYLVSGSMQPEHANQEQKLPNQSSQIPPRRTTLKQHKSNEPVAHLPLPHQVVASTDGKPPQARKRKADSGSRIGKDDIKSTEAMRIKQFNIKNGLLNMKNKATKALNDITGIVLNNIKKDVSNSGGNSGASTNATGQKNGTNNRS